MINIVILWIVLIVPWLTLFLMRKQDIKRFMPAAILASLLMTTYNVVADNHEHWVINDTIIPALKPLFVSGIYGVFPVITLWIFYFTHKNFLLYLVVNAAVDFMFAIFPLHYLFQNKLGIYTLINISPWERFILFVGFAIILYGFHKWLEDHTPA